MIFTREHFEKICDKYKFDVVENVARYLGYAVALYFQDTGILSIWLGSSEGFRDAHDYKDAIDKVEKCLVYISKAELKFKKEHGKERLRKMEADFV